MHPLDFTSTSNFTSTSLQTNFPRFAPASPRVPVPSKGRNRARGYFVRSGSPALERAKQIPPLCMEVASGGCQLLVLAPSSRRGRAAEVAPCCVRAHLNPLFRALNPPLRALDPLKILSCSASSAHWPLSNRSINPQRFLMQSSKASWSLRTHTVPPPPPPLPGAPIPGIIIGGPFRLESGVLLKSCSSPVMPPVPRSGGRGSVVLGYQPDVSV